jgi:hypothetical protein
MNPQPPLGAAAVLVFVACAGTALADDPGKTRAQVYAELVAARQAGTVVEGEPAVAQRDVFPWLYPAPEQPSAPKTRAQVRARLKAALRSGEVVTGLAGLAPRQVYPSWYPSEAYPAATPAVAHAGTGPAGAGAANR